MNYRKILEETDLDEREIMLILKHIPLVQKETAKQIFEELEKIFKKEYGDSVPNFHTFLIKDCDKIKAKFLQERTKNG